MKEGLYSEALRNIKNLSLEEKNYKQVFGLNITSNDPTNRVYAYDDSILTNVRSIIFSKSASNSKVYLGRNLKGDVVINVQQNNSIVYIGDDCNLRNTEIRTQALGATVLIGNRVSTTGKNVWLTGSFPGSEFSSIIIGDDCLFSNDVTIRGSDGHPIMTYDFQKQINAPTNYVVIEPYVWIGQDVKILKGVRIGACSIVGIASVITRIIPRFSVARGVPAIFSRCEGIWIKNRTEKAMKIAKYYLDKYNS
ncbi:acyltransferase [Atlantibacter hermannii]|uniref:acyltransferase n=1 Tax=Atlantibacter hermannii TaxID=565 RepID=UPI00289DD6A9|nr:acyltransferase [Atlantibacter hermannii]